MPFSNTMPFPVSEEWWPQCIHHIQHMVIQTKPTWSAWNMGRWTCFVDYKHTWNMASLLHPLPSLSHHKARCHISPHVARPDALLFVCTQKTLWRTERKRAFALACRMHKTCSLNPYKSYKGLEKMTGKSTWRTTNPASPKITVRVHPSRISLCCLSWKA